jgi:hypothetical protein
MDTLYTVNSGSRDLRWGASTDSALGNVLALGYNCFRIAVMPGQQYLYVTGFKEIRQVSGFESHAWLAVVDTCSNTVTRELDLGIGFAGQCAVPPVAGLNRAYIAVSRALGDTDAGAQGPNRIVVLDVTRPEAPSPPPAGQLTEIRIPSPNPYGPLSVVWSSILDRLYTCHRSDGTVFSVDRAGNVQQLAGLPEQPIALGLAENQGIPRLFIGRRLAGDLVEIELSSQMTRPPQSLQNAATCSGMFIAANPLDPLERVLVTATRPDPPCTHLADGILNIFQRPTSGIPQVQTVDIQGSRLGQPAVHADGSKVYIPRGDQNDIAVVDLNNNTLSPAFISAGNVPSDIAVVSHDASARLQSTPQQLSIECMVPTDVMIRVFDACSQEMAGKRISASTGAPNVIVSPRSPQDLPSPATFSVQCTQGGPGSVHFAMTEFPHSSLTLGVQCVCPSLYCGGFGSPGPVPATITIGPVTLALSVVAGSPNVTPRGLQMSRGTVRLQVPASAVVQDLTITLERMDTNLPEDRAVITHSAGTATVLSSGGLARGVWVILGLHQGITEWRISGGSETYIREICFFA